MVYIYTYVYICGCVGVTLYHVLAMEEAGIKARALVLSRTDLFPPPAVLTPPPACRCSPAHTLCSLSPFVRTVAAPPSIVVKCGGWFFVWSFVALFLSCRVLCCCGVVLVVSCVVCSCCVFVCVTCFSSFTYSFQLSIHTATRSHTLPLLVTPLPYMLNTRNVQKNTVSYSHLACFVNTLTLNMYGFLSYTGFTRRNTLFIFVWRRHRNT